MEILFVPNKQDNREWRLLAAGVPRVYLEQIAALVNLDLPDIVVYVKPGCVEIVHFLRDLDHVFVRRYVTPVVARACHDVLGHVPKGCKV